MYPNDTESERYGNTYYVSQRLGEMVNTGVIDTSKPLDNDYCIAGFKTKKLQLPYNGGQKTEIVMNKDGGSSFSAEWLTKWDFKTTKDYPTINYYMVIPQTASGSIPTVTTSPLRLASPNNYMPLEEWAGTRTYTSRYNNLETNIAYTNSGNNMGVLRSRLVRNIDLTKVIAKYYFIVCTVNMSSVTETDDYFQFAANGARVINDIHKYIPGGAEYDDDLWNIGYTVKNGMLYFIRYDNNFSLWWGNPGSTRAEMSSVVSNSGYPYLLAEIAQGDAVYYCPVAIHGGVAAETQWLCNWENSGIFVQSKFPGANYCNNTTVNYHNIILKNDSTQSLEDSHILYNPTGDYDAADGVQMFVDSRPTGDIHRLYKNRNHILYHTWYNYYNNGRTYIYKYMPLKDVFSVWASFGFTFTGGDNTAKLLPLGENYDKTSPYAGFAFYPVFDDDGTTTGEWVKYTDATPDQINKKDTSDYSPVDPKGGGSAGDDGTPSDRGGSSIGNTRRFNVGDCDGFITQYCMSAAQVSEMGGKIWEALALRDPANTGALLQSLGNLAVQFEESVAESAGLTVRPGDVMSNIIALRQYPFNLADFVSYESAGTDIFVGNGKAAVPLSSVVGKMTTYAETIPYEFGGGGVLDVPRRFNDFRDYDAKYEIYIPFCGTAELPAENVVGTTLSMHYGVDFATGGMVAVCLSHDSAGIAQPVAVLSGQVGANVPLAFSGQTTAEKMLTTIAGGFNIVSRAGRAIALQGLGGLVNPDLAYDAANLAAQASRPDPVYKISSGSDFASLLTPDLAYLSITYGKYNIPENYAHTVGNAVNTTAQLDTLSGFTVCENVDVSGIPCSAEEAAEIKKYLESGVYL